MATQTCATVPFSGYTSGPRDRFTMKIFLVDKYFILTAEKVFKKDF
jgi:hypothetical protein